MQLSDLATVSATARIQILISETVVKVGSYDCLRGRPTQKRHASTRSTHGNPVHTWVQIGDEDEGGYGTLMTMTPRLYLFLLIGSTLGSLGSW